MVDDSDFEEEKYRMQVLLMLAHYVNMWSGHLGEIKGVADRIELKSGTHPLRQTPYRACPKRYELIEEHVNKMISGGVIEPVQINWSSPIVIVLKKDGTPLFCMDYRERNEVTIPHSYLIPHTDD